ncbi:hypothetical protein N8I77_005817 [Diaporthe amygdali]|uniref:J domain-containing protein n=1 Tax=Phomopsis amygdali TaxID=1214568 RepID=A0AAD9SGH1_PHOAM|nr:hypothetical protein N8I77_005817 [Diaporthe amygdali]
MSDAKVRDLYADLGLAGQQVSQREIRDAYKKLALKSHPDKNLGGDPGATVEFVKASPHLLFTFLLGLFHIRACDVQNAYEILGDPEKRAEFGQSYSRFQHHAKTKSKQKYKPGCQPSSDELRSSWEQKQATMQQRTEALRREYAAQQAQHLPDQEFKDWWNQNVDQMFNCIKRSTKDTMRRENGAFAQREVDEASQLREEKAGCERAAAEQARAEDVGFIIKEAKESILILAGMEKRPKNLSLRECIKQWEDDYIQRLVQRTNGLLDYLWTKSVAGGWICPEIKDAVKVDQLVGLILRGTWTDSNFPPETRSRAASLLKIWLDPTVLRKVCSG